MEKVWESPMSASECFQVQKEEIRKHLLRYTRTAFQLLPLKDMPRILDVGCGSGVPTMELARLSQGEVLGIDIDQSALDKFKREIEKAQLTSRVQAIYCSILDMDFPDESFDIVWSEGSIYTIGFESGLRDWKRLLKRDGYMVIHDEQGNIDKKLKLIFSCGYELLAHFKLDTEVWWTEYFAPLEEFIAEFQTSYTDDTKILEELRKAQEELDIFKKNPEQNCSVYFIIQRKS